MRLLNNAITSGTSYYTVHDVFIIRSLCNKGTALSLACTQTNSLQVELVPQTTCRDTDQPHILRHFRSFMSLDLRALGTCEGGSPHISDATTTLIMCNDYNYFDCGECWHCAQSPLVPRPARNVCESDDCSARADELGARPTWRNTGVLCARLHDKR